LTSYSCLKNTEMSQIDLRKVELCFLDIETTGPVFGYHEVIEIGAIRTSHDTKKILGEYEVKIVPEYPQRATLFALELNGFSVESWQSAQPVREAVTGLSKLTRSAVAVCHNPSFDRAFIQLMANAVGVELNLDYHWIGTESLAWCSYKHGELNGLQLADLCAAFGIDEEPIPHRALEGARTCLRVYRALMLKYESRESTMR
jgi:DNA polymerase III epsilon subunit-like protein